MADTSSENLIKRMSRWLLASATLILVLQLTQVEANAAAGLSEVWSETDGMRMKYSTNHGDLLSSKGSEMSLSSDQKHHQLEPAGGAESGNGDDSAAAAAAAEGGGGGESQGEESSEQAKGETDEGGSEQADSHKTEKVVRANPTAGRVHSYSSLAGQTGPGAAQSSRAHHQHQFRSSASSRSTSGAPSSSYDFSGSAPEDQMVNDNGEATGGDGSEQSSADAADEPLANEAPAGAGKFRAPGKHFKEAVKMVGSHKQETKADSEDPEAGYAKDESEEKGSSAGAPDETPARSKSTDEADESPEFNAGGDGSWGAALERQAASGKRAQAQEEHDYGRPFEGSAAAAGLDNESPLSMAGSPLEQPEQHLFRPATPRNQMMGVGHFSGGGGGEESDSDEQVPLSNFRSASPSAGPMFYEGSAQSSRALPSAGNSHRERSQPSQSAAMAGGKRQPQQQQQQQQQQQNAAAVNKQSYKQLSYFKSVPDHPQRAGAGAARGSTAPVDSSPDSVRDNFISPGHYPGSMPHLTQAASEIAQSKSTAAAKEVTRGQRDGAMASATPKEAELTKSSSQQATNDSTYQSQSASVASDTNEQRGATTTAKQPAAAAGDEQQNQVAESKEMASVVTVTPVPEAQQESQQIMAPILVSTTTMAPLPPTPAASSTTTPAPSSSAATTTSQTPALKRFKFRKYR